MTTRVEITIPASTANLGPGFDCMGLALALHNTVEMSLDGSGLSIEILGEGAGKLRTDQGNAVARAARMVFDRVDEQMEGLHIKCVNRIPPGRGLGSSAAALVGGLTGANALLGSPLSRDDVLRMAVEMEGHPDNVSPALLGGLTVGTYSRDACAVRRVPVAPIQVAAAVPSVYASTSEQRAALPRTVPFRDAVVNIGRALLVMQALAEADYDLLAEVMHDRLHEPTRRKAIPAFEQVVNAAYENGASAVVISGAGSGLIAFAPRNLERIAESMAAAFRDRGGVEARSWVLPVDMQGTRVSTK